MSLLIPHILGIFSQIVLSFSFFTHSLPSNNLSPYPLQQNSTYLVVAPRVLRPGRPYEISISISNIKEPVQVEAIIKRGSEYVLETSVEVTQSRPGKVKFMIPNGLPNGKYRLAVFGRISSLDYLFLNETNLQYMSKAYSTFIQTDKPIYKASQKVQFRVITVDPDLKPYNGPVNISIYDGKNNKIKQWLNGSNENGVISQNLQLSDQPVLGNWKIKVEIMGAEEERSFSVDEYVLPKFEVKIEMKKYALWKDSILYVPVTAKYTFGKPVSGNLELQVKKSYINEITLLRTEKIDNGVSIIPIPLRSLYSEDRDKTTLTVTAIVTEPLTNVSRNASATIDVYKNDINLKVIRQFNVYKPGLPFIFNVIVMKPDESPVIYFKHQLNLTYTLKIKKELPKIKTELYKIPESGIVKVILQNNKNERIDNIEISYGEVKTTTYVGGEAVSRSNNFIRIIGNDEPVKVDGKAIFEVMCTEPVQNINYVVLSQEQIIKTGLLKMKGKTGLRFSLIITRNMAPLSRLLLYYTRNGGEVVADVLAFDVNDFFQNKVTLEFQLRNGSNVSDSVSPGDEIFLTGSAAPNSFVGIVAVDQSVLLLKEQNDITESVIAKELNHYSDIYRGSESMATDKGSFGFDSRNTFDVFWNAGAAIMTNADIYTDSNLQPIGVMVKKKPRPNNYGSGSSSNLLLSMSGFSKNSLLMDGIHESARGEKKINVRTKFPESWIWINIAASENGEFSQNETVPDSITSWVASAISVDKTYGLGVTNNKAMLKVFRPFFVSINLPYSVIRGEVLQMQVLIFNYLEDNAEITLELQKSDQFELAVVEDEKKSTYVQKLKVDMGKPGTVTFPVVPLVAGLIDIKVVGKMKNAADAEQKKLLVKPEGVTQYFSSSLLIDLRNDKQTTQIVSIDLPAKDIVPGSERAEVSSSGDLFGNTINNLDNLVRVPGGCGEQNLVAFVPDIHVLNYLTVTKQLTPALRNRIVEYLEIGYQRQLTYKNSDGSFSTFGDQREPGSTWLTAFVIKSFQQANSYIGIDQDVLNSSITWLKKNQKPNGSFIESGNILDRDLQGGQFGAVTLAAYIITALQNINIQNQDLSKVISATKRYLEKQVAALTEPYVLSLVSYALTLVDSAKSDQAFEKLLSISKKEGDMIYWSQTMIVNDDPQWKYSPFRIKLIDIEATSYALLTYVLKKKTSQAVPIAKWLNSKRNSFGGFQSTQDTVIGLEALTAYAGEVYSPNTKIKIQFKAGKRFSENFAVDTDNALIHQTTVLPQVFKKVQIIATGTGTCLAQVSWQYNHALPKETDAFILNITPVAHQETLTVKICVAHKENLKTGMVVMEVSLPSGYGADLGDKKDLLNMKGVQRIDNEDGDTKVVVYFNEMTAEEICLEFMANQNIVVEKLKATPVSIYEYYSPDKRTTRFYKPLE